MAKKEEEEVAGISTCLSSTLDYQRSKETPPTFSPRCTVLRFPRGPSRRLLEKSRNRVAEILEITPQIKTFYPSLTSCANNYLWPNLAKDSRYYYKILSLEMRPHSVNIRMFPAAGMELWIILASMMSALHTQ